MKTLKKSDFNTILTMKTVEKKNYTAIANYLNSQGYKTKSGRPLTDLQVSLFMIQNGFRQRRAYIKPNAKSKKAATQMAFDSLVPAKNMIESFKRPANVLFTSDEFIEIMSSNIQTPVKKKLVNAIMEMVQN